MIALEQRFSRAGALPALVLWLAAGVVSGCGGSSGGSAAEQGSPENRDGDAMNDTPSDGSADPSSPEAQPAMPAQNDPSQPTEPAADGAGTPAADGSMPSEPQPGASEPAAKAPGEVTRIARLSHAQYQNTVSDLLGISDPPGDAFAPDALNGFEFDTTVDLPVDARLGPQYRAAAEQLGERAATDAQVFARIVPCDTTAVSCPAEFIADFGKRAFRRPLTEAEQARFETLFASGGDLVGSGDAFGDGVRVVVEALLQSPQFLYRTEQSNEVDATTGRIALNGYEIASRLSYFLWNTMPDDELFDAAESKLSTEAQIENQVERMLADERATQKLVSFHEQAWQFDKLTRIAPDLGTFPDAPSNLSDVAGRAERQFVADVIENGGGLNELLTANYAFADESLAPLYGQDISGDLQRIDFADGERRGILMQVGFLAANAHSIKTDPIHRGLFVMRNLLCVAIPDPDASFAQLGLPETDTPPETTRQEVELLTGTNTDPDPMRASTCGSCHSLINPAGFAFEGFDAVGEPRSKENGVRVDTSGSVMIDGTEQSFKDALELVQLIADSQAAHDCYAQKLTSFAYGHRTSSDDADLLGALRDVRSTHEAATLIATAASFRERVPNEVGP